MHEPQPAPQDPDRTPQDTPTTTPPAPEPPAADSPRPSQPPADDMLSDTQASHPSSYPPSSPPSHPTEMLAKDEGAGQVERQPTPHHSSGEDAGGSRQLLREHVVHVTEAAACLPGLASNEAECKQVAICNLQGCMVLPPSSTSLHPPFSPFPPSLLVIA